MAFKEKYSITPRYLTPNTKRRSGLKMSPGVKFIVAHDTGNPNSTANGNVRYYENSRNEMSASAHLFVDDREIIECVPALTGPPEKAWHVLYGVPTDNQLFGFNANDAAVGVEYCYGTNINADEAYARFVWVMAFICYKFELDPRKSVVGHFFLDPNRKTDPVTGLARSRRTYEQLLEHVVKEYEECTKTELPAISLPIKKGGTVKATVRLNVRKGEPNTIAPVVQSIDPGTTLDYASSVLGQSINGNPKWYKDPNGNYFWSGGVV
ncbi:N-acetylmuramoyl-L-alanine amidase [Sphingobacteriales bacterium CHB3]|nr:N-acetylmuramoyl-L-alanine amidase [Sphingobacteriales bacterium CHB3]